MKLFLHTSVSLVGAFALLLLLAMTYAVAVERSEYPVSTPGAADLSARHETAIK